MLAAVTLAGCAGDLGAGDVPTCTARPVDPPGFTPGSTTTVEENGQAGQRFEYTRTDGARLTFLFGIASDAGSGLPKKERLALLTAGDGQLLGRGLEWAFTWNEQAPCDPMAVVGAGLSKQEFIAALGLAGVIPREEEEGEGAEIPGGEIEGGFEEEEELGEGEIDGAPPTGPAIEWVAIFESARRRSDLEEIETHLNEIAPANAAVLPASCWRGLSKQLGVSRDAFAAGLVAVTGNELDFHVERVQRNHLFYGQLRRAASCPEEA